MAEVNGRISYRYYLVLLLNERHLGYSNDEVWTDSEHQFMHDTIDGLLGRAIEYCHDAQILEWRQFVDGNTIHRLDDGEFQRLRERYEFLRAGRRQ